MLHLPFRAIAPIRMEGYGDQSRSESKLTYANLWKPVPTYNYEVGDAAEFKHSD